MQHYIAIAGNIGVGKSTLVRMMNERLGWEPFYEAVVENPYLADFYADMPRYAFHSQIFFLTRRLHAHRELLDRPGIVVQDRSVYEDAEIFARNLFRQGNMSERDYRTYDELYRVLAAFLTPPDLIVYLRASVDTLLRRIAQRGREYEKTISPDYLAQLNELYEEWASRFTRAPVLIVPADRLDYVQYTGDLELVLQKVQDKLRGEQLVLFD
ncbi:MAG TPA: deoxynucleoside kinase [Anaerolineae bacterium]